MIAVTVQPEIPTTSVYELLSLKWRFPEAHKTVLPLLPDTEQLHPAFVQREEQQEFPDLPGTTATATAKLREGAEENTSLDVATGQVQSLLTATQKREVIPALHIRREATAFLTSELKSLSQRLFAIAATEARLSRIPITSAELTPFREPEEGWTQLVVDLTVDVTAEQALAFSEHVWNLIDAWVPMLSPRQRNLLLERVTLHIWWW